MAMGYLPLDELADAISSRDGNNHVDRRKGTHPPRRGGERFRSRTPAREVISADWRSRVPRSEIRSIAAGHPEIGELPPELDREFGSAFSAWYIRMAKRAMRELDPDWRAVLKATRRPLRSTRR